MLDVTEDQIATHAGGQVDDDVGRRGPDPLDDLGVEFDVSGRCPGLGIADVDVDDGGPGLGRLDAGRGDLGRGDRDLVGLVGGRSRSGHRAGDEDAVMHRCCHGPGPLFGDG